MRELTTLTLMPHYVALLRGINLGNRRMKMEQLKALFEEMKFSNVATFIASGNVLFESKAKSGLTLAKMIEAHLAESLGYEVDTFVRTRTEVAAATAFCPFPKAELERPTNTLHVGFWRETPSEELTRALIACRTEVDEFCVEGREFYWLCRIKTNESKVWTSPKMKAAKMPSATMRNITSLRKLLLQYPVLK